ncbi:putative ABC transporter permease YclI [Vallitalea longa]|uniref:ABC transporter permease YclI n=1 Tax=Vallitalea longa TaxID=2936439 RepID=A0A9W5YE30_9FIRM|nr:ABC transporter permease [Vallitalea longa]GKX29518.1 putative ABC transporter permease YclI [Vallitalea longa]
MYFIKRALKYIKHKKGKTLLLGIIFLIIANFVLAGLLVYNATVKAQQQTRESIGADVKYIIDNEGIISDSERGVINKDDYSIMKTAFSGEVTSVEKYTDKGAPTYANFMNVVDSTYVDDYDLSISFQCDINDLNSYTTDTDVSDSGHTFDIKLFGAVEPMDFEEGNAELVEGNLATMEEISSGEGVVLVEENVASINNLQIGDTITATASILDYENIEIELKIIGIYKTNEQVDQRMAFKGSSSLIPQNRLYVPFNIVNDMGLTQEEMDNLLLSSNVIHLKDPIYVEDYKTEAEQKVKLVYGSLDANDDLYNSLIGPIEKLGVIAKIMVIIIAIAGAAIIGLITALTVNDRKEEIGIMLAVGESKAKIVIQFVIEVTIIAVIAFVLSSFTGSIIGENISSVILDSEIVSDDTSNNNMMNMKMIGRMGNININQMGNDKLNKLSQEQKVDINFDINVLLELFGLGLLMSIISTIIPSLYVMRFNPKQILINRT